MARTATPGEIAHAYRALLRRHHPDTRDSDLAASADSGVLQQVIAAYRVLRDPVARARYDDESAPPEQVFSRSPRRTPAGSFIVAGPVRWHPSPGRRSRLEP